jgi:isopenicillin-N epimerase
VVRRIDLFDSIETVSEAQIVARLMAAITPATRAFALTWVHSSTGLKLPLPAISAALAQVNATRQEPERIILAVDGVHGFGNQDATLASLGCDIFMAGCHKWLFGPRGTGVIAANAQGWSRRCGPRCPAMSTAPPGPPGSTTPRCWTTPTAR